MTLIIEVLPHGSERNKYYKKIQSFPVSIGRGFNNDIIIDDPYVEAVHASIECKDGKYKIIDNQTLNGTYINNQKNNAEFKPGDIINLGQSELKIYSPELQVKKALPLKNTHPLLSWISKPLHAWGSFAAAMALVQTWAFFEIWTDERGQAAAAAAAVSAGAVILWSALWSAASKLLINKPNFTKHWGVISTYLILSVFVWYIESYADFLITISWLSNAIDYSINMILLALVIYGSLYFASNMPDKRKKIAAGLFAAGVIGGFFGLSIIGQKSFSQVPVYKTTLKPFLAELAPTNSAEEFALKNKALFNSKEFKL